MPGVPFAELAWRAPGVLQLSRPELAARLAALRFALPPQLDLAQLLARAPQLLLQPAPGAAAAAGLARLRQLFPGADAAAIVRLEPLVLLADLSAGAALLRAQRAARSRSAEELLSSRGTSDVFAGGTTAFLSPDAELELAAEVATPAGLHALLHCQQLAQQQLEEERTA